MKPEFIEKMTADELLEWLADSSFDLRCEEQRGYDDSDVLWVVYSHHIDEPKLRPEGYGSMPDEAIRDAMIPKGDPRRWDYAPEFIDKPNSILDRMG